MSSPEATSDHFDLLPFISILMCVLGCLLLVTISMSAISLGVGAAEAWTPKGIAVGRTGDPAILLAKDPILVEWDGQVATFQLAKRRLAGRWTAASPTGNAVFQEALKSVTARMDSSYLLVAVRPSGFSTLGPLLDVLRATGIEVGYEPVEQARPVTLASVKPPPAQAPPAKTNDPSKARAASGQDASSKDDGPTKDESSSDDVPPSKP